MFIAGDIVSVSMSLGMHDLLNHTYVNVSPTHVLLVTNIMIDQHHMFAGVRYHRLKIVLLHHSMRKVFKQFVILCSARSACDNDCVNVLDMFRRINVLIHCVCHDSV